jgi:hypothetical protein
VIKDEDELEEEVKNKDKLEVLEERIGRGRKIRRPARYDN